MNVKISSYEQKKISIAAEIDFYVAPNDIICVKRKAFLWLGHNCDKFLFVRL